MKNTLNNTIIYLIINSFCIFENNKSYLTVVLFMKIIKYPELIPYEFGEIFIKKISKVIDLSSLKIKEIIIVCNDDEYDNAIKYVDKNSSFTNNAMFVGIAKTINSTIIYKEKLIKIYIFNEVHDENYYEFLFTIFHEFGHVKDNSIRPYAKLNKLTKGFSIKKVTEYYSSILLDEFAANMFACKWVNKDVILNLKENVEFDDNISIVLDECKSIYNDNEKFSVSGSTWALLKQALDIYTLLFLTNTNSKNNFPDEIRKLRFKRLIQKLKRTYPNWNEKTKKALEKKWEKLSFEIAGDYPY
jgi:hypothetical protein